MKVSKMDLKNEIINGKVCTFKKYPNGYVVGKCSGYEIGSCKTKKETIAELRKRMRQYEQEIRYD